VFKAAFVRTRAFRVAARGARVLTDADLRKPRLITCGFQTPLRSSSSADFISRYDRRHARQCSQGGWPCFAPNALGGESQRHSLEREIPWIVSSPVAARLNARILRRRLLYDKILFSQRKVRALRRAATS